jgi:hypothetical protein
MAVLLFAVSPNAHRFDCIEVLPIVLHNDIVALQSFHNRLDLTTTEGSLMNNLGSC